MSEFEKALTRKIKGLIPNQSFIGKVVKVDEVKYTCTVMPLDSDAEIFKVRLKPTIDNEKNGIIAIPSVDSFVIVGLLNNNENSAFVVWCSNIKKYYIVGEGGNTLEFKDDGTILINGDAHAGLVKVAELVTQINKMESDLNSIKTAFNAWVVVGGDGGAALKALSATWAASPITQTVKANIENTRVKHG